MASSAFSLLMKIGPDPYTVGSTTANSVTLEFVNPTIALAFFEYRIDGVTVELWSDPDGDPTTDDGVLVFMADFIPSLAHVHLPWVAGFDLNPLLTLSEKRQFLSRAAADDYLLVFQHDASHDACRVEFTGGRFRARDIIEDGAS